MTKAVRLGFVDLGEHTRARSGTAYPILPASSHRLEALPVPESAYKRLTLNLINFYAEDLPDLTDANEALLRIVVNTRDPQALTQSPQDASFVTEFNVNDGEYSPRFLYKGVFRNVLFQEWINLRFRLHELDDDLVDAYKKARTVIADVPELKHIDVFNGLPYVNVATSLFDRLVKTFGKNRDDEIWGEAPTLETVPTPGGAFLRSGIYVLHSAQADGEDVPTASLRYEDERLHRDEGELPDHLIFGVLIRRYEG